jgi:ferredoxin-type protein NapF
MTNMLSRRHLFSRLRGGPAQLRPPWSLAEDLFVEACTQCGGCLSACPTGLVRRGHAGYPIVVFDGAACTFCAACADACKDGCFDRTASAPWPLKAVIAPACVEAKGVTCRMCGEACEAAAIRFRPKLGGGADATIDAGRCTGCGACVSVCPVGAISITLPQPAMETAS